MEELFKPVFIKSGISLWCSSSFLPNIFNLLTAFLCHFTQKFTETSLPRWWSIQRFCTFLCRKRSLIIINLISMKVNGITLRNLSRLCTSVMVLACFLTLRACISFCCWCAIDWTFFFYLSCRWEAHIVQSILEPIGNKHQFELDLKATHDPLISCLDIRIICFTLILWLFLVLFLDCRILDRVSRPISQVWMVCTLQHIPSFITHPSYCGSTWRLIIFDNRQGYRLWLKRLRIILIWVHFFNRLLMSVCNWRSIVWRRLAWWFCEYVLVIK